MRDGRVSHVFNGSDTLVEWMGNVMITATGPPFTMSSWFNSASAGGSQTIISIFQDGNDWWTLRAAMNVGGDPVRYQTKGPGADLGLNTTTGATVGQWHHAAARSVTLSDHAVFIDGGSKATSTTTIAPSMPPGRVAIGHVGLASGSHFNGKLFWITIWTAALADEEISRLALGAPPWTIRPQSIAGLWALDEPGFPGRDSSRYGRHGAPFAGMPTGDIPQQVKDYNGDPTGYLRAINLGDPLAFPYGLAPAAPPGGHVHSKVNRIPLFSKLQGLTS